MSSTRRLWIVGGVLALVVAITMLFPAGAGAQSNFKTLHRFRFHKSNGGLFPAAGLVLDQAGNLYGTASAGGLQGRGTVFELTPNSGGVWTLTVIHAFTGGADGANPFGTLIFDQSGNLYGTTSYGGANDWGTVFKLTPRGNGTWTETVLYSFCSILKCTDGAEPSSSLIFDQAGNLYGTTTMGGSGSGPGCGGCGTAFKLTPHTSGTWTERVLYSFCSRTDCRDGATPYYAGLVFDPTGNLYGTTFAGGRKSGCNFGCGTVFELSPNGHGGWKESVLHAFCSAQNCRDGGQPLDPLIFDKAGNLYGTAEMGGTHVGVVFELSPIGDGSWQEKVLHDFVGGDGSYPVAGLIFDQTGNLYGTAFGGPYGGGAGVVFKLTPHSTGAWVETVLHAFLDKAGARPYSGLIFDPAGNLYGTTFGYSRSNFGSVYQIMP